MKQVQIPCRDEHYILGTLLETTATLKGAVIIGPATGIPQKFYQSFAEYLAEKGYHVVLFDNRGIGKSRHTGIDFKKITLRDWGYLDLRERLTF